MHILSLPPELTVEFFLHLVDLDPPGVFIEGKSFSLGWLNVTFVCQYWRNQAIGCPGLWTDIWGTLGPSWLNAFLERSRESLILLRGFGNDSILSYLNVVLPRNLHRIRHLSIGKESLTFIGTSLVSRPAPEMRTCHLAGVDFSVRVREDDTRGPPSKDGSSELLAANAPQLRSLTLLEPKHFPWNSLVLSELVSLGLSLREMKVHDATDMLLALQNMKQLEHLILNSFVFHEVLSNTHKVELSRLKNLAVVGDHTFFHYVYRHILHPRSTRLKATCLFSHPHSARTDVDAFLTLMLTHPTRCPFETYRTLAIGRGDRSLLIDSWEEELPITVTTPLPPSLSLSLRVQWSSDAAGIDTQLEAFSDMAIRNIIFPATRVLRLDSRCHKVFRRALPYLPSTVSTLSFAYGSVDDPSGICDTLAYLAAAWKLRDNGRRDVILPNLQTLSFAQEQYGLMTCPLDIHPPSSLKLLDVLRKFAVTRKERGARLRTIYVHPSTLRAGPASDPVHIPSELEHLMTEDASQEDLDGRQAGGIPLTKLASHFAGAQIHA